MLPEDRLDEALDQVEIVMDDVELTVHETDWLLDAERNLQAVQTILERQRQHRDDAEVIDE